MSRGGPPRIALFVTPKGDGGAQVTAQHEKFPDATTVAQM